MCELVLDLCRPISEDSVVKLSSRPYKLPYLWEASEDGGSARGAAADRGESVLEYQAAPGESLEMRGADHCVVINLCLEPSIVTCLHIKGTDTTVFKP